jgi:hypothetical protein
MSLLVPLKGGGQAVAVEPADLALDGLLRILRTEEAPVSTWLSAGHHLLAAGREKEFEALLTEAVEREQQQGQTPQDVFTAIQALCSLAEFTAQQAVGERDRRQRFVQLSRSTELCHRAQRLSFEEQLPELVLGYVALVKVRAQCCCFSCIAALQQKPPSPALTTRCQAAAQHRNASA